MEITSTAFKDGEKIPIQYVMPGAGGKNISVPLSWKNAPSGTKSFALSMVDPAPGRTELGPLAGDQSSGECNLS